MMHYLYLISVVIIRFPRIKNTNNLTKLIKITIDYLTAFVLCYVGRTRVLDVLVIVNFLLKPVNDDLINLG